MGYIEAILAGEQAIRKEHDQEAAAVLERGQLAPLATRSRPRRCERRPWGGRNYCRLDE